MLFWIILVPLAVAAGVVTVQMVTENPALHGLFSYRMVVLVGPIATTGLLGWVVASALRSEVMKQPTMRKAVITTALVCTLAVSAVGANGTRWWFEQKAQSTLSAVSEFVKGDKKRGDTYVVPAEFRFENFRVASGVPVFVDWQYPPAKDTERIEWGRRISMVRQVYGNPGKLDCAHVTELVSEHQVTHFLATAQTDASGCSGLKRVYSDAHFAVYRAGSR